MLPGEVQVSEDVLGRVLQELGRLGELRVKHPSDLVQLLHGAWVVGLGEHRPHDRRDGVLGALGNGREQVAHEVHAADSHCQPSERVSSS